MSRPFRLFTASLVAGLLVVLAGCATPARRPLPADAAAIAAQAEREARLDARRRWSLEGRVAMRNGQDGGSGQLDWKQDGSRFELALRAPVSGQGWRLSGGSGTALLEGLEGGPRRAEDADLLLAESVGWDVPLARLTRWVRGQRGSAQATLGFDADGLPLTQQDGAWRVEYQAWERSLDPPMPRRIEATSGERRLRLLVRSWRFGDAD